MKAIIIACCLFSFTSSFCMEKVNSDEQGIVPPEYIETLKNVHVSAQRLITLQRSRPIMTGLISAGAAVLGMGSLLWAKRYKNPRLWSTLKTGVVLTATGAAALLIGSLTSWLWRKRSLPIAIANANDAALKLHEQEAPLLCSLFVLIKQTKANKKTFLKSIMDEIQQRISVPRNYNCHVQSEVNKILSSSFSMTVRNNNTGARAKEFDDWRTMFQTALRDWFLPAAPATGGK